MLAPDEVAAMVQLHRLGWGTKRIAAELGCSRNTVKRYLAAGGWVAIRQRRLDGLDEWLAERFRRHRGNCDVVRQDLLRERGITVHLQRSFAGAVNSTDKRSPVPAHKLTLLRERRLLFLGFTLSRR
jgi:DNA-binding transcriptional regulator LsrR (DeoR family)